MNDPPHDNEPLDFRRAYERSNYRLVGKHKHSALKPCHWLMAKLYTGRQNRNCYKGYFGIKSEKCIQCTPALPFCTHNCVFCWRDMEKGSLGASFSLQPDEPKSLVSEFIRNQVNVIDHHVGIENAVDNHAIMHDILAFLATSDSHVTRKAIQARSGYSQNKIETALVLLKLLDVLVTADNVSFGLNPALREEHMDVDVILKDHVTTLEEIKNVFQGAHEPSHAAISLAGEPTLYPHLSGLVSEFRKRSFTTFVVSNGTTPDVLGTMEHLPTQLYVTLPPPDEAAYKHIHRPAIKNAWSLVNETLDLLPSLSCRTCLRVTLVKGLNDFKSDALVDAWVRMIESANPHFLDIKGFSVEARALLLRKRLGMGGDGTTIGESATYAPTHEEVLAFAKVLSDRSGFPIVESVKASRDVLLLVNWPREKSYVIRDP
nr:radical SAM protein [Candidatus Sigynarchaeota archaeon]